MSDKVLIAGLRVFGHHGLTSKEKERGQIFVVDVEAHLDLRQAGRADDLGETVDYSALIKDIQRIVSQEEFDLIEALAERIAGVILANERVVSTIVRVGKPQAPIDAEFDNVAVEVHRSK